MLLNGCTEGLRIGRVRYVPLAGQHDESRVLDALSQCAGDPPVDELGPVDPLTEAGCPRDRGGSGLGSGQEGEAVEDGPASTTGTPHERQTNNNTNVTVYGDLSPYSYLPGVPAGTVNVGWLGDSIPTGPVPAGFLVTLDGLRSSHRANLTREGHRCPFCSPRSERPRGHAEIHVSGVDGRTYAAPELIVHYVAVHEYQPPQKFIDVVLATRAVPDSEALEEFSHLWAQPHGRYFLVESPHTGGDRAVWDSESNSVLLIEDDCLYEAVLDQMASHGVPVLKRLPDDVN